MQQVKTFTATIYVGFWNLDMGCIARMDTVRKVCADYVDVEGLCVSVTDTEFIYTQGIEPGAIVGLINYPRFPETPDAIRNKALTLAERLRVACGQHRVSVVMPHETVTLGDLDA